MASSEKKIENCRKVAEHLLRAGADVNQAAKVKIRNQ